MGGLFGGKAPQAQKQQPAGALNVQTSIYGSAYPLVYGKNRVPVNLIHYLNFKAIPHTTKQKTGGKGGGGKTTNTTYTYQVAMAASVGVGGPGTGVGTIWRNKEKHTLSSLGLTFFGGAAGQTAWSYLTGAAPSQAVPYANMAYIAGSAFDLGDSPSLPNLNVEFMGLKRYNPGTNDDALLSDIIVDYLTDTRHGAGFGTYLADLDSGAASFRKYCLARGLFISPIENNQRNAGAFLKEMAEISNSAMVWKNGKLHFIPYGDATITGNGATYTPDLTPLYDLGEKDFLYERGQPPVQHSTKNPSQQFNHVRIEYNNRANDYNPSIVEVKDGADIDDNGLRTKPVRKCSAITLAAVARDVAQLEMQRDLFVVNSYSFRLGVRHSLLEPMDYLTITEPGLGLDRQLVRITEVVEQDDAIDVVVEEVLVGVANAPLFNTVGPQGYNQDFNATPGNTQDPLIMNAPGLLTQTGFEMWINACGVNANLWGGCQVWISDDNVSYRLVGDIMGPARYGALAATFAAGSADYDTTSVARVQLYNGQMIGGTQEDVDDWRTLLYIGGEWVSYRDAVLVSGTTYDLDTFRRAGYGSTRTSHASGQAVAVIDEATFRLPYDKGNVGKQVYFKFPAFNVFGGGLQDLSACTAYPHTIGASELTAPMNFADIGGNGVNLLPDQVSTFESTTLPHTGAANLTPSRVAGFITSALQLAGSGAANGDMYSLLNVAGTFSRTKGKNYIISCWARSDHAGSSAYINLWESTGAQAGGSALKNLTTTWTRYSWFAELSGNQFITDKMAPIIVPYFTGGSSGKSIQIDGIMVEEAVGLLNNPSAYTRGTAGSLALSALVQALDARAIADGQVDIYRQSAAPAIGGAGAKLGDYWQDSDDGKWYYCNGSSWVESTDSRLPQVVVDAAAANSAANTAQTTANARIRLFVQEAQPTGGTYIVGDQWYQQSTKTTRYYNGAGWSLQADQSGAVVAGVPNGRFEAGLNYWINQGFWTHSPTAGMNGTGRAQVIGTTTAGTGWRLYSEQKLPVRVGQKLIATCHAIRNNNVDDGTCYLCVFYWDAAGTAFGYIDQAMNADTNATWKFVRKFYTVPANAVYATVGLMILNQNASGAWAIDNIDLRAMADNAEISAGVGKNLVRNASFGKLTGSLWPWTQGWNPHGASVTFKNYRDTWTYPTYKMPTGGNVEFRQVGRTGGSPGVADWSMDTPGLMQVKAGKRYEAYVRVAAYRCALQLNVAWYDANDTYISEAGTAYAISNGGGELPTVGYFQLGDFFTAPSNAAGAVLFFRKADTDVGQADSVVFLSEPFFGEAGANQTDFSPWSEGPLGTADEIPNGADSTTIAITDIQTVGFSRRLGLSVKGSRKILGGARNSRASIVYGASAVRTTTALSANSSGQVTVNAHNVEISGETVTYNGVTNAVTGLTPGSTYVIFTLDPFLDGGTRTYYAQTSVLNAQQAGEGAVFIGNITIPTSGTGTGGSGGVGNPGDWCVDWDTVLPDGRFVRDLGKGDLVRCIDVVTGKVDEYPLLTMGFGEEECYRLVTPELHSIVQSRSAPMDLPNGKVLTTEQMFGQPVYIWTNGEAKLSMVCDLQYLGKRRVLKPDFGNRMFFAGERAEASIATHNAQYKP